MNLDYYFNQIWYVKILIDTYYNIFFFDKNLKLTYHSLRMTLFYYFT